MEGEAERKLPSISTVFDQKLNYQKKLTDKKIINYFLTNTMFNQSHQRNFIKKFPNFPQTVVSFGTAGYELLTDAH